MKLNKLKLKKYNTLVHNMYGIAIFRLNHVS